MKLGAFSISLAVKDIKASREFYEKLGFSVFGGNQDDNWLMLQNGIATIGLFQGMFESNIITFNPGWDQNAKELAEFTDVRDIQSSLKQSGLKLETEVDAEKASGPGHLVVLDPDGNTILIDQHR